MKIKKKVKVIEKEMVVLKLGWEEAELILKGIRNEVSSGRTKERKSPKNTLLDLRDELEEFLNVDDLPY